AALDDVLVPTVRVRPRDHLDDALLVLEHERRVAIALPAVLEAHGVDDTTDPDAGPRIGTSAPLAVPRRQLPPARAERARRRIRELPQILLPAVERMATDEETDRLALGAKLLVGRPGRDGGERRRRLCGARRAEQADLRRRPFLGTAGGPAHDVLERRE